MTPNEIMTQEFWATMCRSTHGRALQMGTLHSRAAADMMLAVAKRFCDQPAPTTPDELSLRQLQAIVVSSFMSTIAHAGLMARLHPRAASQIFELIKKACERELPTTKAALDEAPLAALELNSQISAICYAHSTVSRPNV